MPSLAYVRSSTLNALPFRSPADRLTDFLFSRLSSLFHQTTTLLASGPGRFPAIRLVQRSRSNHLPVCPPWVSGYSDWSTTSIHRLSASGWSPIILPSYAFPCRGSPDGISCYPGHPTSFIKPPSHMPPADLPMGLPVIRAILRLSSNQNPTGLRRVA